MTNPGARDLITLLSLAVVACGSATGRVYEVRGDEERVLVAARVPTETRLELRYAVVRAATGWVVGIHLQAEDRCVDRERVSEEVRTFAEREARGSGPVALVGLGLTVAGMVGAGSAGDLDTFALSVLVVGIGQVMLIGAGFNALGGIDRETDRKVVAREEDVRSSGCAHTSAEPVTLDLQLGELATSRAVPLGTSALSLAELFPCEAVRGASLPPDVRLSVLVHLPRPLPTSVKVVEAGDVTAYLAECGVTAPATEGPAGAPVDAR